MVPIVSGSSIEKSVTVYEVYYIRFKKFEKNKQKRTCKCKSKEDSYDK